MKIICCESFKTLYGSLPVLTRDPFLLSILRQYILILLQVTFELFEMQYTETEQTNKDWSIYNC